MRNIYRSVQNITLFIVQFSSASLHETPKLIFRLHAFIYIDIYDSLTSNTSHFLFLIPFRPSSHSPPRFVFTSLFSHLLFALPYVSTFLYITVIISLSIAQCCTAIYITEKALKYHKTKSVVSIFNFQNA
jgi:hypothetical protein